MVTFSVSLILLILGYILYGRLLSKVIKVDPEKSTPAYTLQDGVDYVPMPTWKLYTIQFLNIAGTGPIFGAIMGSQFGSAAYIWIVIGCIFGGATHDYLSGMISLRHNGESHTMMIQRYLGKRAYNVVMLVILVLMFLVGSAFVYTPAGLLASMTSGFTIGEFTFTPKAALYVWAVVIFIYYIIACLMPIDKIIGRIYPVFAVALIFMAVGIMGYLFVHWPSIPELTDGLQNMKHDPVSQPIFPLMFVTIACGAVSGFHATQSPMMARCMKSERYGRPVFYGAMITEGIVALIWCAAANAYFYGLPEGGAAADAPAIVNVISKEWLGPVGGVLALLGIVFAPITTGDTALRSVRLIIADHFHIDQKSLWNKLKISLPVFAITMLLLVFTMLEGFDVLWRYLSWVNQILAVFTLWACTVYLYRKRGYWHYIMMIPAIFMTMVVIAYIFIAPEGFGLVQYYDWVLLGAGLAAILISRWFYSKERKLKTV